MTHVAARFVICSADGDSLHFLLQEGISDLIHIFESNLLESTSQSTEIVFKIWMGCKQSDFAQLRVWRHSETKKAVYAKMKPGNSASEF